jgi:hypothetical protein
VNDGMVGYWKLDEAAAPALDASGRGMNGTYVNAPLPQAAGAAPLTFSNPRGLRMGSVPGTNRCRTGPGRPGLAAGGRLGLVLVKFNALAANAQIGVAGLPNLQYLVFKRNSRTTGIFEGYSLVIEHKFEFGLGSAAGTQDIATPRHCPRAGDLVPRGRDVPAAELQALRQRHARRNRDPQLPARLRPPPALHRSERRGRVERSSGV